MIALANGFPLFILFSVELAQNNCFDKQFLYRTQHNLSTLSAFPFYPNLSYTGTDRDFVTCMRWGDKYNIYITTKRDFSLF